MRSEELDTNSLDPEFLMEGTPDTLVAAEVLSNLYIGTATDGVSGSKEPETAPAEPEISVAVVKKVKWRITAEESAIDNGVVSKEVEASAGEDLQEAEGVDGDAVGEIGNEAEGGDAEESSSDEEDNDEEESNGDEDDSSQDGEDIPAEVYYTDEDVQKMLEEFYQFEQEAIEAQEKLEDESLKAMRSEVSLELAETKSGPELEGAVEEEMATYVEIYKETLADLEDEIAILQEKLEDSGVDLPQLYKTLEKEVPDFCTTEAWKKRTHWAGLPATAEAFEVVQKAELDLKTKRPVRRHHGRIQDEGASGFLKTKVKATPQSDGVSENDWSLFDALVKDENNPGPGSLMGTEKWASVYLADTPEQAAQLGLVLPGVDDVEEIGDINSDKSKLFEEALASEGQQGLTGKQKTNLKKVREEDDVKKTRRLQRKQLPPRPRKPRAPSQKKLEGSTNIKCSEASSSGASVEEGSTTPTDEIKHLKIRGDSNSSEPVLGTIVIYDKKAHEKNGIIEEAIPEPWIIDSAGVVHPREALTPHLQNGVSLTSYRRPKRRLVPTEIDADSGDAKRRKTVVMIDSDGEHEVQELANETKLPDNGVPEKDALVDSPEVVVLGSRKDSSQRVQLENQRSASWLLSSPQGANKQTDDEPLRTTSGRKRNSSRFIHDAEPRNFDCTACGMPLKNREVMKHPSLDVGICRKCKTFLFSGPFNKDEEGLEDECRWCGQGGDVLCCETCDKVFCCPCIKRNLGQEVLDQIADSEDWKCFFCNKQPLHELRLQYQAVKDALRAQAMNALDAEDDFGDYRIPTNKKSRNRRKNIRRVLDDGELDEKTKNLLAIEKERQELLESWRAKAKANGRTIVKPNKYNRNTHINDQLLDMDEDDIADEGFILNKARSDDEEPVRICPHISRFLKPHQLAGMRFMWENCIESVSKVKSGADGLGCILAHSMGLGKTLQVIGFVHTVLKKQDLGPRTVLIVVPVNVLHNWRSEFHKWQPGNESQIPVYMLEDVARDNINRAKLLAKWQRNGGVMLIGYTAFRNLSIGKTVKEKVVREKLTSTLQCPGPDILVCDEAHMIKNHKADITQALRQVRTHRRIALTGSPLQNNLMEYYCMVDFVREGFLGGAPEFRRRFVAPIENGQRADSTSRDVKLMKHRAHVLHKQLIGFVQRKTMSVLKDELPSKCVYVISVKLSPLQRALYLKFLEVHGFSKGVAAKQDNRNMLFKAYHTLAKIWNHPDLLIMAQEEKELREDNVENFIVDRDDDVPEVVVKDGVIILNDDETVKETGSGEVKSNALHVARRADEDVVDKSGWWKEMMEGQARQKLELSGKMVILMKILSLSSTRSDKALVFSQSLHTLDLIEHFLESMPCLNGYRGNWKKNRDWYRLDGQTSAKARQELVERFNDPENTCVQCVLISTRAGSLGINLPAANRVIIFDGSWNPTHDLQALFRAWRFGQTKNVYAYRLLAAGTMEEKIYNRQVAKEGLAARVLDEHQVARHFFEDDLEFFYVLDEEDEYPELEEPPALCTQNKESTPPDAENSQQHSSEATTTSSVPGQVEGAPVPKPKRAAFSIPHDAPPRDDIMGKLLLEYRPKYIGRYHEHEPLLEDIEDEKLSKEEQTLAWESFQYEESAPQNINIAPSTPGVLPHIAPSTPGVGVPQFPYFQPSAVPHPLPAPVQYNLHPHSYTQSQFPKYPCNSDTHIRQLKAENVKTGTSTVCGLCNQIISWETTKRP